MIIKKVSLFILTALFPVFFLSVTFNVYAADYPDTLRVGFYYGSGAVQSMNFESNGGFTVGYTADRTFKPFGTISNTSITVTAISPGTHFLIYASHDSHASMTAQINELSAQGIEAVPAWYKSSYCVLSTAFSNYDEALAATTVQGLGGIPVTSSEGALAVKDSSSGKLLFISDSYACGITVFTNDYTNTDATISISGAARGKYRGGFECKATNLSISVTNIVDIEAYLYSVVGNEMSPSWHVEALKAQTVCARNFALGRINHHKQYGFDVCRTTCCQTMSANTDLSRNLRTAVDETCGELLFYEDKLAQTVYASSMGASTESVEYVWGTPYPYLVSVPNPYEDTENIRNGKWEKTLTKNRATEIMNQKGYKIGTVTDIIVLENTPAGGVLKLCVRGTDGEKIFQREGCRSAFSEITYSQRFTVTPGGVSTPPTVSVLSGNGITPVQFTSFAVVDGNNTIGSINETCTVTDGTTNKTYAPEISGGDPDTFIFSGEGWGHGVGMSQYGAKGMAEAGFSYRDILTHYYTGTHIEKAY